MYMKAIKNITKGLIVLSAVALVGCSDDYLETVPTDQVSDVVMAETVNGVYLALNGIHREMVSQESNYQCFGGLPGFMFTRDWAADDITCHATSNWWSRQATWQYHMDKSSGYQTSYWRVYYQWILNANKILEALEKIDREALSGADQDLYDQIKGEALCIRAFAHYDMVQQYAKSYVPGANNTQPGVPYRVTSEVVEMERTPVDEVYRLINADLDNAVSLLAGKVVNDVNHYSEKVALGLKARVALTMGDYTNAAKYAEQAISVAESEGFKLMSTPEEFTCGFADITSDTSEALYAALTPDDQTVYFYSFYAYMSWNFNSSAVRSYVNCMNKELYDSMSETDYRRAWADPTGTADVPASNYKKAPYQNRKFRARATSNAVGNVAFMRLAELYLIASEAYARAGQESAAKEIFTKFQQTRDPEYTTSNSTGEAFITEIMNSRRVELWGEGQRYFDLKRLHQDLQRDSLSDAALCGFTFKDADADGWVFEIPQHEVDYNPLCTYNY